MLSSDCYNRKFIFTVLLSDIDECAVDNGGCDEICVNHNGSYLCQCDSDLQLLSDKRSCGCEWYENYIVYNFSWHIIYLQYHPRIVLLVAMAAEVHVMRKITRVAMQAIDSIEMKCFVEVRISFMNCNKIRNKFIMHTS